MANDNNQILNVQPHSEDAEQAVLGSMLSSKEAVSKALQWLTPIHFYKDAHGKILSTMIYLFDNGEPIDNVSVIDLKKLIVVSTIPVGKVPTDIVFYLPNSNSTDNIKDKKLQKKN